MSATPTPTTTRADAAAIFVAYLEAKRPNDGTGIQARAWFTSGSPTDQLVRIYLSETKRKVQKRFGREVTIQQSHDLGYVDIGKDGRVWTSNLRRYHGKISRMLRKSIGGIEVEVQAEGGASVAKPLEVVEGRRRVED